MGVLDAFKLDGKVAVVTGGNMGLGEAFARALADVGAQVVIAARTLAASERTVSEIVAAGGRAIAVEVDVTQPDQVTRMTAEVSSRLGPIDILVNKRRLLHSPPRP